VRALGIETEIPNFSRTRNPLGNIRSNGSVEGKPAEMDVDRSYAVALGKNMLLSVFRQPAVNRLAAELSEGVTQEELI